MQTVCPKTLLGNQLLKSVNRKVPPGDSISSWLRSTIVQPILPTKIAGSCDGGMVPDRGLGISVVSLRICLAAVVMFLSNFPNTVHNMLNPLSKRIKKGVLLGS